MITKKIFFLSILSLTNVMVLFSQQTIENCVNTISGNVHGHLTANRNCTGQITITATENEQQTETLIDGVIEAREGIRVIPGHSSVRFIPTDHETIPSSRLENQTSYHKRKSSWGTGTRGYSRFSNKNLSKKSHNTLVMFPNPAKDYVVFSEYETPIKAYEIVNANGVLQLEGEVKATNTDKVRVDISTLPSGHYIVNITLSDNSEITKLLIKH